MNLHFITAMHMLDYTYILTNVLLSRKEIYRRWNNYQDQIISSKVWSHKCGV